MKKKLFFATFWGHFFASSQMEVKNSHFYGWNFFMYTICITHTVIHKEFLLRTIPYCFTNKLEKSVYPEHWILRIFIKFLLTPFGSRPVIKFHYHEKIFFFMYSGEKWRKEWLFFLFFYVVKSFLCMSDNSYLKNFYWKFHFQLLICPH